MFYRLIIIMFVAGSINLHAANNAEKKGYLDKTYHISASGNLNLSSTYSDIEIFTWDRNEVKITGELTYESVNEEDARKLLDAFKNSIEAKTSNNSLELTSNLFEWTIKRIWFKSNVVMTLNNGYEMPPGAKIKTSYKLWIPESLSVTLNSKYGSVNMANIKGNVNLTLQKVDLKMGDYGSYGAFDMGFSTATIGNGGSSVFKLSNSKVNVAAIGHTTIDTHYSTINIKEALDVQVNSSNDSFVFGSLNNINTKARYSTFIIEDDAENSKFDLYNTNIFSKDFKSMEVSAQFSKFNVKNIGSITILSSYSNRFETSTVNTITCKNSKHDKFRLGQVFISAEFNEAQDSEVNIIKTGPSFKLFSGNFKDGGIYIKLDPAIQFVLNYQSTHGNIDIQTDRLKSIIIPDKNNPTKTFEGSTDSNAKCNIKFTAYSTAVKIE